MATANYMAKQRYVNTRFWIDSYISNLDPIEKLLFLYCLTNQQTDISGVYEVPLKTIATDTGIDKEMVIKILNRFEKDGKVRYEDGWIAIKNFIKHQQDNPKILKGIELSMAKCPSWCIDYVYSIDSLSHSNSNSNTNTNTNVKKVKNKFSQESADIIKLFEIVDVKNKTYYSNKTQRGASDFLIDEYGFDKVSKVIGLLPQTNQLDYFPRITSPNELKEKWTKLATALQSKKRKEDFSSIML